MHVGMLLQMAADGMGERIALGPVADGTTMAELAARARRAGTVLAELPGERVAMVDLNSEAVPIALFGATLAGKPFVPINYRLTDEQLRDLVERTAPATVIVGEGVAERLGTIPGIELIDRKEFLDRTADPSVEEADPYAGDPDSVAVLLFTSGTTGAPKAAVLRNRNLTSYVISTVEFAGAGEDEAAIVSVPPYHIAGISSVLSSTYSGRRVVHLETFEPRVWVDVVRAEGGHPRHGGPDHAQPHPRRGGRGRGRAPVAAVALLRRRPDAAGRHRAGHGPAARGRVRQRLRAHRDGEHHRPARSRRPPRGPRQRRPRRPGPPGLGRPTPAHRRGGDPRTWTARCWARARGARSGCGASRWRGSTRDSVPAPDDGWFNTRDEGHLDDGGFLFVHGRLDDVIVRGGENLSPGEIETVLLEHPSVAAAAVVGIPDADWGEKVVAAVVPVEGAEVDEDELRDFVRRALRSTRTPERIEIRDGPALQRDRQAAAPGAPRGAGRPVRLSHRPPTA